MVTVTTDASLLGWGGVPWLPDNSGQMVTSRDLPPYQPIGAQSGQNAYIHFLPFIRYKSIKVMTDNVI